MSKQATLKTQDREPGSGASPSVQLSALTRLYHLGDETVRAVDAVDLTIHYGEYVAVVGPSGSGKSTLLQILGCLDTPSSGSYLLDGEPVVDLSESRLAEVRNSKIGFIFQGFHLLPRATAQRNVELPLVYAGLKAAERRRRARSALAAVGLEDRMNHRPSELSGGQRQRVAIARALVTNPAILLADEPTGNLDTHTGGEIMNLFDELRSPERTLIMVTHDLALAQRAQRLIALRDGRIEFDGPPSDCPSEVLHA
ncbi:MAG: putative ABC transport system ATP-binding protein [Chlamydiales bacterium]|jgi:putative ABC transport system ATP-binding protein